LPKITQEKAVQDMYLANDKKYTYANFIYTRSKDKPFVTCPTHGDFPVSHDAHLRLKSGCPKCNGGLKKSQEDFINDCKTRHGQVFCYKDTIYINDNSNVTIRCREHGFFTMKATNHLQGQGCKKCSKNGYNPNKVGFLYILKSDNVTKVGITNRNINTRIKEINKGSGKKSVLKTFITFSVGSVACSIESELLSYLKRTYVQEIEVYTGSTECFHDVDYDELLSKLVATTQIKN
jgi:hypothetical protein